MEAEESKIQMRLAPNPATTEVQILVEGVGESGGELTVLDAQGRTVWQQRFGSRFGSETLTSTLTGEPSSIINHQSAIINLSDFPTGLYFVTLRSEGSTVTKRLVVQRL